MSRFPEVTLRLPSWIDEIAEVGSIYKTPEDQIGLAIELSRRNVEEGTGGPFGAAVFDLETGALIAPGVNLVQSGPPMDNTVGAGGGYGGIYCFALEP